MTVIDPGNIGTRQNTLTLNPDDPTTRAAATHTVRRVALDETDAAELLAMLGLDQEPTP